MPEQRIVRNDLIRVQQNLVRLEAEFGKNSMEYKEALKRFSQLWSMLRMTRSRDEFLGEILS